jgi:hypothetical protein
MEDEVFDSVNQLYDYVPNWFQVDLANNIDNPRLPLNTPVNVATGGGYGRWLLNRYIAEIKGVDTIRQIWQQLSETAPPANASLRYEIDSLPIIDGKLGGKLDEYVLGLGRRMVLGNWVSHRNDLALLLRHSVMTVAGTQVPLVTTYPTSQYSFTFLDYATLDQASIVDFSFKPASIAALPLPVSSAAILLLCNNVSGSTVVPVDPLTSSNGVPDAVVSMVKSPTLVSGPAATTPVSGSSGGGGCFIATAAYGSYLHPKVLVLRGFRDRWLLTHPVGRVLVACYYRVSPAVAAVIARHEFLRRGFRAVLAPVITMVEHPECFAALVMGLLGWAVLRRRVTA